MGFVIANAQACLTNFGPIRQHFVPWLCLTSCKLTSPPQYIHWGKTFLNNNPETIVKYTLNVNSHEQTVDIAPETPLLYALRNDFKLNGPKFGCGLAQCGACTVHVNGSPVRSCVTPVASVTGKKITTIEGLGNVDKPHPVQAAFIAEQAGQCGYCLNGMVMSATALLAKNKNPSDQEIRAALNGNLCRCGTQVRILRAVKRAAAGMRGETV
jgi:nicotinate dehydrogenase subunit A